ncbi:MAG: hypothetical protein IJY03_06865 [Prevotella sp.]|nr:hypothetical protein [Prevotella sp.]
MSIKKKGKKINAKINIFAKKAYFYDADTAMGMILSLSVQQSGHDGKKCQG